MPKIKTIHINCDKGEADFDSSYIITIERPDTPSYGLFTWKLSECFFRAQMLHNEKLSRGPFKVAILIPTHYITRHKPEDTETGVYRIEWYIRNMIPPDIPIIFTIYYGNREFYLTNKTRGWLWPLKYQWDPNYTENYVTVQLPEIYATPGGNQQRQNWENPLKYFENNCPYPIKYIGYHTPIDEAYNLLKYAKYHFTYFGATYYLAAMMGVPSIIMGFQHRKETAENWDTKEEYLIHHSVWPKDQIVQLRDLDKKSIYHSHVKNFSVLRNVDHLKELMDEYAAFTDKKSSN